MSVRTSPKQLTEFQRMVRARGQVLRNKSREELIEAGQQSPEKWDVSGRPASVYVIVEDKDDGSLRVIVQGIMPPRWFSGLSSLALDGFYRRATGVIEPMPEEEFWEFG